MLRPLRLLCWFTGFIQVALAQERKPHWEKLLDDVEASYTAGNYRAALAPARQLSRYSTIIDRQDTAMLHRLGRLMLGVLALQTDHPPLADSLFTSTLHEFWLDAAAEERRQRQTNNPLDNAPLLFWENRSIDDQLRLLIWYHRWVEALVSHNELGRAESLLTQQQFWANAFTPETLADAQRNFLMGLANFYRNTLGDNGLYQEVQQALQRTLEPSMPANIRLLVYQQYLNQLDQLDASAPEVRRILAALPPLRRAAFDQSPMLQMIRTGLRQYVEFYERVGQWDRAEPAARAYHALWYIGSHDNQHPATRNALHGWVRCLTQQDKLAAADSLLRVASLAVGTADHERNESLASLASSRGAWYHQQKKYRSAITQFDSALTYLRASSQPDTAALNYTLGSLLGLQARQPRHFAAAERHYSDWRRLGPNARADGLMARIRLAQGRYEEATKLLQPLVDQVRNRPNASWTSSAGWLRTYALAQYATQPSRGREGIHEAGRRLASQIAELTSTLTQQTNESLLRQLTDELNEQIGACIQTQATDVLFDLLLAIRNRQIEPLRAVNQRSGEADSSGQRYYQAYRNWQSELVAYQQQTGQSPLGTLVQARADQAEVELRRRISLATPTPHWTDVQQALKAHEVVIEFITHRVRAPDRPDSVWYYALLIRPSDKTPRLIRLFEQQPLQRELALPENPSADALERLYRGGVTGGRASPADSLRLYRLIWQPIDSLLTSFRTVYLVPTGLLHNLSFAAIRRPNGSLLFDAFTLRYRLSSRLLTTPTPFRLPRQGTVLLAGDINYTVSQTNYNANQRQQRFLTGQMFRVVGTGSNLSGVDTAALATYGRQLDSLKQIREQWQADASRSDGYWKPLPGSRHEVDTLAYLFSRQQHRLLRLTDVTADEWRLRQVADSLRPTVLHVATHGYFTSLTATVGDSLANPPWHNPLIQSGLVMAGANLSRQYPAALGNNDGLLSALDLSTLNLTNTKLAVLSACETGLGEEQGSEGTFGLQRALKLAGVNYIMQSLWRIPDRETVLLMAAFYEHLLAGDDAETAFETAQRQLRNQFTPYYWAAFVLLR